VSVRLMIRRHGTSILLCCRHDHLQSNWRLLLTILISWHIQTFSFAQNMQMQGPHVTWNPFGVSTGCRQTVLLFWRYNGTQSS
jgi:hypothetical protein